jgi:GNAT superfamily N-acetyltransferase
VNHLHSYTFSTWTGRGGLYLEDLFVNESMRGQGVGKALFGYLGKLCKDLELPRMDWVVLDWNKPAQDVYRRMGAKHVRFLSLSPELKYIGLADISLMVIRRRNGGE